MSENKENNTNIRRMGRASLSFVRPPVITAGASAAGTKEGAGPLASLFDLSLTDDQLGQNSWEEAESRMQKMTAEAVLKKAGLTPEHIRYLFAGDLLGQLIATSFGLMELEIPLYGLYGACSTFGEAMGLGALTVASNAAERVMALASSHFATAEKQFRFPLGYGNQRPLSASWTATGCGAVILSGEGVEPASGGQAVVAGITTGKIVDFGLKDSMNMGAAMAPAAFHTILQSFRDFDTRPEDYDQIFTGDLGEVGKTILLPLLEQEGYDIRRVHRDCGLELFDRSTQDVHAGGSGCGCSAMVFVSLVLPKLQTGEWKRVLFVPTGALLSTVSFNEGKSVPGIAHGVVLEHRELR